MSSKLASPVNAVCCNTEIHVQHIDLHLHPTGKYVSLEDSIAGFKGIMEGKYDDLPEMAFYMVGDITEVQSKADKMAKDMAA